MPIKERRWKTQRGQMGILNQRDLKQIFPLTALRKNQSLRQLDFTLRVSRTLRQFYVVEAS